jgi:hypothetical protein
MTALQGETSPSTIWRGNLKKYILIVALLATTNAYADSIKDVSGTKDLCTKAAGFFANGDPKKSMETLKPFWPIPSEEVDNIAYQSETQLKMVSSRFGKTLGADFIRTQTAGTSFVQHTFIAKFEKHAVRFICVFYKPRDEWYVNTVTWDDKTSQLFE